MKYTIYYGSKTPIVAVGHNQCRMLAFAEKYQGWHSFAKDEPTRKALLGLAKKGCIEIIDDQFRFKYPLDRAS